MADSLSDAALAMFQQTKSADLNDLPEDDKPFAVAAKSVWDAVERKDMASFREALRDAITIATNEG